MAMTTCSDCKKEISDSAKTCPHCGAAQTSVSRAVTVAALVIAAGLAWAYCAGGGEKGTSEMDQTMGSGQTEKSGK